MSTKSISQFHVYTLLAVAWFIGIVGLYPGTAATNPIPAADIVVVLDLSGSMKSTGEGDRFDAFIRWNESFTNEADRIAVVAMGHGAKLVAPLKEKSAFSFSDYREQLNHRAKYTDVAAGLENAYYELKTNGRSDASKIILLVSDAQIDMPKGQWDLDNSLRYLHDSLIPAMQREKMKLIAIVPEGLKANFPLLQELAAGTDGVYFRGLPADAVAVRETHLNSEASQQPAVPKIATAQPKQAPSALQANSVRKPVVKKNPSPVEQNSQLNALVPPTAPQTNSTIDGFWLLVGILVGGFVLVFVALGVLFRKSSNRHSAKNDELMEVLEEVQSLKKASRESEVQSRQFVEDNDESGELDFGEPKEQLSVSMVAPFLDYEQIGSEPPPSPIDEIVSKPAFAADDFEDSSLSVSNMETLIGTASAPLHEKE
ncbi:MAG: VWA domain-containing protein [Deltaproteobacteria bacterium]|nr:VWA domain-containing protein [Deltaproteobacteria bacterium]MBN2673337.1 VWA domain-containing protein [Deltaproteobacteria bacterium]